MELIPAHGLYEYDDVWYLAQGGNTQNALGLKSNPEFSIITKVRCCHNIDLNLDDPTEDFISQVDISDPLLEYMLPIPEHRFECRYMRELDPKVLFYLTHMINPTRTTVMPIWSVDIKAIKANLESSNLVTWVITEVNSFKDIHKVKQIRQIAQYTLGDVLFTGHLSYFPSDIPEIETKIPLIEDRSQWEKFGAYKVREFMRGN